MQCFGGVEGIAEGEAEGELSLLEPEKSGSSVKEGRMNPGKD